MRDHITLLMNDLHDRVSMLKSQLLVLGNYGHEPVLHTARSFRFARSPLGIVGNIAHYLFGIVDEDTFSNACDVIDKLNQLSKAERQQLNVHSKS